jgi:D-alanyl-D-alanine carboxypeptidase/D-alanyl-D-alanine-endopeptidase (penicillin-binding protein 4)
MRATTSTREPPPAARRLALALLVLAGLASPEVRADSGASAPTTAASAPARRPPSSEKLREALERLADDASKLGGTVGVAVLDVETGRTLASRDELRAMNPASNAKLPTAVAALEVLGAEHRFTTGLYGKLDDGTVRRLVLRGNGDPGLQTADLFGLATDLVAAGVRKVGGISVDQSRFDDAYVPPAFDQQPDEWAPFRAPVAPVSLARNTVTLWFSPGAEEGKAARVTVEPPGFVDVEGVVKTTPTGKPEKVGLTVEPKGARLVARVSGTIPMGSRPVPGIRRVDDPRLLAGFALRAALRQQGIEVGDEIALGGDDEKRLLASHRSASVGELLPRLGKDSDNFTAEMLFKAIGAGRKGSPRATDAAAAVEEVLRSRGAFDPGTKITNGSGLFDANRLTAHALTTLLASGARDPRLGPELVSHLAIGGVDGTLRSRFEPWRSRRAIRAKTGTLARSIALSGYVLGPDGAPRVAFSVLCEVEPGKTGEARKAIDRAVSTIADEVWADAPSR